MGRRQRKPLAGILKDKASLLKAILSFRRATSSVHTTVIKATAHGQSPAPDHYISAVLTIGEESRQSARACISAIMDRLHSTRDARVALKCLTLLHYIFSKGSSILKEQLSVYPSAGGRNFLNLSKFRDGRDAESWNLSSWVRWYAGFLETNLSVSRLFEKDLVEIEEFVKLVEEICNCPDDVFINGRNLVNEIMNLVVEDYGFTQRQILVRICKCRERIDEMDSGEAREIFGYLKRMEECKEKLIKMFVNRKRNDEFWEKVKELKMEVEKMMAAPADVKRILAPPYALVALPYRNEWRSGVAVN
ncbi:putative clathrin assembly protein At4g40080 [Impatiens glandulifera]|uniref:putative clathrin assembly protein At4g40080 n=1 Tax=Impatiens glandulifera TaxID=253017 RepID=UPI001FB16598|nr:putative clathrin assembly protein At4g40080 [Impatiens glandulifera]